MEAIGWSAAAFTPAGDYAPERQGDDDIKTMPVILATDLGMGAVIPDDAGQASAGKILLHGARYEMSTAVSGDRTVIARWHPSGHQTPWNLHQLTAVRTENATTVGSADEADAVADASAAVD